MVAIGVILANRELKRAKQQRREALRQRARRCI